MSAHFPPGLSYTVAYNASNFVSADIHEILHTLVITLILVVGVVYLFLQDWRATVIPTIAIPVSLIGVFAVLYVLGYSANTIDLFAIVLAITLVVDDAIVVVENVTRTLEENHGMSVAEATEKAMAEITGPVIATTLVLVAVFAPVGFVSGVTGALYRQFAVTISVSVVISAINALTLSPALCALMLKPPKPVTFVRVPLVQHLFDFMRDRFGNVVAVLTRRLTLAVGGIIAVFVITYGVFEHTPTAFLPAEDQGYFLINVQLPNGASLERTSDVVNELTTILHKTPGVEHVIGVSGFSIVTGAQESSGASGHRHPHPLEPARPQRIRRGADGETETDLRCDPLGGHRGLQSAADPRRQRDRRHQLRARSAERRECSAAGRGGARADLRRQPE